METLKFLLGFAPWILLLFIAGHSLASVERSLLICLGVSIVFGFNQLRRKFILQWATLIFFLLSAILINGLKVIWLVMHMGIMANAYLAAIMWATVLIGKPFTLQYARAGLPPEAWHDEGLVHGCRFLASVWAVLMSTGTAVSVFKYTHPGLLPEWAYFDVSLALIVFGIGFTGVYKRIRQRQRGTRHNSCRT